MLTGMDELRLEVSIENHLQYNHYPPISLEFSVACIEAIFNCVKDNYDKEVKLPNGKILSSRVICDELHLWDFVAYVINP